MLLTAGDEAKAQGPRPERLGYLKKPVASRTTSVRMVDAIVREPTTLRSGDPGLMTTRQGGATCSAKTS